MAAFQKFNSTVEALAEKVHNLGADTIKVMLSNVAPIAGNSVKADITEIAAGNGYVAGGSTLALVSSSQTAGVYKLVLSDVTITAAGGSIGPFRYAVVYNDTATNDELIGFFDYGSSISLLDGESLLVDVSAVNGLLTIQ